MRVLPHALRHAAHDDAGGLLRDVALDGVATHGHPRALVGAAVYAYAAWWLLRASHTVRFGELVDMLLGSDAVWGAMPQGGQAPSGWGEAAARCYRDGYGQSWRTVVAEMRALLASVQQGLSAGVLADDDDVLRSLDAFGPAKGAGTVTAAAALYLCARHAARPVQGVLKAAFSFGIDTDTVAAMTAALFGCLAGRDWLPAEWTHVQDVDYVKALARELADTAPETAERMPRQRPIGKAELNAFQHTLKSGANEVDLDGVRRARMVGIAPGLPLRGSAADRWRLITDDGQTLYVTRPGDAPRPTRRVEVFDLRVPDEPRPSLGAGPSVPEIRLKVASLEASARFYETTLGLVSTERRSGEIAYGPLSLVVLGETDRLFLEPHPAQPGPLRLGLSIHVSDISVARQRVEQSGACIVQDVSISARGETLFYCLDPDGNKIEVIARRPPQR
jgi:catechol-2,3-dioxygenase